MLPREDERFPAQLYLSSLVSMKSGSWKRPSAKGAKCNSLGQRPRKSMRTKGRALKARIEVDPSRPRYPTQLGILECRCRAFSASLSKRLFSFGVAPGCDISRRSRFTKRTRDK